MAILDITPAAKVARRGATKEAAAKFSYWCKGDERYAWLKKPGNAPVCVKSSDVYCASSAGNSVAIHMNSSCGKCYKKLAPPLKTLYEKWLDEACNEKYNEAH